GQARGHRSSARRGGGGGLAVVAVADFQPPPRLRSHAKPLLFTSGRARKNAALDFRRRICPVKELPSLTCQKKRKRTAFSRRIQQISAVKLISGRCMDLLMAVHCARDDPSGVYILFISPDKPICTKLIIQRM
uniref:Uncharacterized protein n=1 Tax=Triticum urartu TaxID=4572 RepID=A0A8R7PVI0_TRIUA